MLVKYVAHPNQHTTPEFGIITGMHAGYVFVRFWGDRLASKACKTYQLTVG